MRINIDLRRLIEKKSTGVEAIAARRVSRIFARRTCQHRERRGVQADRWKQGAQLRRGKSLCRGRRAARRAALCRRHRGSATKKLDRAQAKTWQWHSSRRYRSL